MYFIFYTGGAARQTVRSMSALTFMRVHTDASGDEFAECASEQPKYHIHFGWRMPRLAQVRVKRCRAPVSHLQMATLTTTRQCMLWYSPQSIQQSKDFVTAYMTAVAEACFHS